MNHSNFPGQNSRKIGRKFPPRLTLFARLLLGLAFIIAALLILGGALGGVSLSRAVMATENGQTTKYCDFTYTGPAIGAPVQVVWVFGVPISYVCAPCQPFQGNCSEDDAANYVNGVPGRPATSSQNFANYSVDCDTCAPPPSPM